ncbi:MAG TPA: phage tail protein [Kofleriaceae bacterium]|nr:phage tail protein [Kofleriaceae bacterium]
MTQPAASRNDPLTTFCFRVKFEGGPMSGSDLFFKSVGGLKYESEVVEYKEGGRNVTARRLVGPGKYPNLVLKKGFTGPPMIQLLAWRRMWLIDDPGVPLVRASGVVIQLNSKLESVCGWKFHNGWPCKWEGPDYDASKAELAIETLEIAHEGLEFLPTGA